jgi:hypothetical protein
MFKPYTKSTVRNNKTDCPHTTLYYSNSKSYMFRLHFPEIYKEINIPAAIHTTVETYCPDLALTFIQTTDYIRPLRVEVDG